MRMLRWISVNTRKDQIRSEKIRLKIGVASSDEKMRENCLRCFGHVKRRVINAPVRNIQLIQVEGTKKGRRKPKITLIEVVKKEHVN